MEELNDWLEARRFHSERPERQQPWVNLCYAQSLDGSLTVERGKPLGISGPESLMLTHRLRAWHDALLVGIGTVLADDPSLTVRLSPGNSPQPVIVDSQLRFPLTARLLQAPQRRPWIATLEGGNIQRVDSLRAAGAEVIPLPAGDNGKVSLPALLAALRERQVQRLMVEGGAGVLTAFLEQELANGLVLTIAPFFVGGLRAPEKSLSCFPHLVSPEQATAGADWIVWGDLEYPAGGS